MNPPILMIVLKVAIFSLFFNIQRKSVLATPITVNDTVCYCGIFHLKIRGICLMDSRPKIHAKSWRPPGKIMRLLGRGVRSARETK